MISSFLSSAWERQIGALAPINYLLSGSTRKSIHFWFGLDREEITGIQSFTPKGN
jgi:hypothetical protein